MVIQTGSLSNPRTEKSYLLGAHNHSSNFVASYRSNDIAEGLMLSIKRTKTFFRNGYKINTPRTLYQCPRPFS